MVAFWPDSFVIGFKFFDVDGKLLSQTNHFREDQGLKEISLNQNERLLGFESMIRSGLGYL